MPWYETAAWLTLALVLEKLLDYVVWPTWKRKKAISGAKKKKVFIIKTPRT